MRVLMFGWEFPPHIAGGLGTACYGIVKGLVENGVETLFVMPSASGDEDGSVATIINASDVPVMSVASSVDEFLDKVRFVRVGSNMIPYTNPDEFYELVEAEKRHRDVSEDKIYGSKYRFSGKYGSNLLEEVARYAMVGGTIAVEHKDEFDVIHAHDWLTYLAGIAAKELTGKPLVVHVHATSFDRGTEDMIDSRVYSIEKRGMEAADKVIAVSDLTRNIVINKYGISPDKVVTVHNAVDFSGRENLQIERRVKDKVVTFLGRITYQKGPEYFVEAAYKILQVDPTIHFVMAGTGDLLQKMIKRVAQLKIGANFHFTGFLKGNDVDQMFAMTDVFVMPSISEPFGIVPLEAMRLKVPVVISKQSGVSEVVEHALKVDFWDINGLADAIYGICKYKAVNDIFRKEGKEEVDNLKWEYAAKKIKTVYERAIGL